MLPSFSSFSPLEGVAGFDETHGSKGKQSALCAGGVLVDVKGGGKQELAGEPVPPGSLRQRDLTSQLPSTGHLPSLHRVLTHSQGNRWQGWASQGWETGQRCPSWHLGAVQKVKLDMIRMNLGLLE